MNWLVATLFLLLLGLASWRWLDRRADDLAWKRLIEASGPAVGAFDPAMIEGLPEPARRYFLYTIERGAPLRRVVEIEMTGELGFGTKQKPDYRPMSARQILAPPHGFVWRLKAGPISGSDGAMPDISWTRFWLFGLVPIVRVGLNDDHHRSAFGRVIAEAAFWAPASLLPGETVTWAPLDATSARATVRYGEFTQAVDITVAEDGRPTRVLIERWSNENPDRVFREQPFGGDLAEFRTFGGYRLPTRVEGGNHFGTDAYFPFYKANVTAIRFPAAEDAP